jgi:hypothetical protein
MPMKKETEKDEISKRTITVIERSRSSGDTKMEVA